MKRNVPLERGPPISSVHDRLYCLTTFVIGEIKMERIREVDLLDINAPSGISKKHNSHTGLGPNGLFTPCSTETHESPGTHWHIRGFQQKSRGRTVTVLMMILNQKHSQKE